MSTALRPFVDYYRELGISPVDQDIADLRRHFERRESLYRALGIAPKLVQGRSVIEFGPGSGHNSLYTLSLAPSRYLLVDGNPTGIARTRARLERQFPGNASYEIREELIEEFEADEQFDLVLAEGLIPFQNDPASFLRTIARSVAPGGVLVITCVDAASCMGETTRRLISNRLVSPTVPIYERLASVREIFRPHLATLANMSRSVDDWILDNILHPLFGELLAIDEAIAALDDEFDIYGGSPSFLTDWRWFKDLHGSARRFNERACAHYDRVIVNLMDVRMERENAPEVGARLRELSRRIYHRRQQIELRPETACEETALMAGDVDELAEVVRPESALTADSFAELAAFLRDPDPSGAGLDAYRSYFGRGQQYVSFIRRSDPLSSR